MQEIVRTNGIEMAHCSFGEGPRPFVILPGLSAKSVVAQEAALAQGFALFCKDFTVHVFDRRLNLGDAYSVADMARDTACVMEALGLSHVCLFGASQGGMIAQLIAIEHPELVDRLVLGSTTSRGADSAAAVVDSWETLAREGRVEEFVQATLTHLYSPATLAVAGDAIAEAMLPLTREELARFIVLASGTPAFSCTDRLSAITAKTLVIGCFGDAVVGWRASVDIAERLGCELVIYGAEYGHSVYDEAPDYRRRLYEFFMA
mgnify:CR=1 FL=1